MPEEVERKYLHVSREELRPRLLALGAKPLGGPHFESNVVYDRADGSLAAGRIVLRLRTREWRERSDAVLTYKSPLPDAGAPGRPAKVREEIELGVGDARAMDAILRRLGHAPVMRYEKVRESWLLGGAHVDMDELCFLDAVEIEAPLPELDAAEAELGLDKNLSSAKSYHLLHLEWRRERGLPPLLSFVFPDGRRAALRRALGLRDDPFPPSPHDRKARP